jgi:membrane-associated protease RseP (regulator of RpoE activity)
MRKRNWLINLGLFVLATLTTTYAGACHVTGTIDITPAFILNAWRGWVFSVPLMAILLVHEMGHFAVGRLRFLDVTPPFFIPAFPPIGTFGAFIKIRSPISNLTVLAELGASGPIAGSLVAIPLLAVGLYLSDVHPNAAQNDGYVLGASILLKLLSLARFGEVVDTAQIAFHPTAKAAWFGLFVTAMNLLPVGQLDGGHVVYALFGPRVAKIVSIAVVCCLVPLGYWGWQGWLLFGALVLFVLGVRHPSPVDPYTHLDGPARVVSWTAVTLMLLTFVPVPISVFD